MMKMYQTLSYSEVLWKKILPLPPKKKLKKPHQTKKVYSLRKKRDFGGLVEPPLESK